MREILFKAKRIDNGEWVEGYYFHEVIIGWDMDRHIITTGKVKVKGAYAESSELIKYEINPNTLCQYTGLVDKKRNKIWENDIVNLCEDFYVITWEKDDAMFALEDVYFGISESFKSADSRWCEIIGNTIDNPELLDKQIETKFD